MQEAELVQDVIIAAECPSGLLIAPSPAVHRRCSGVGIPITVPLGFASVVCVDRSFWDPVKHCLCSMKCT